jgi:hypothetical protein
VEFIEASLFTQAVADYLDDEEYRQLQAFLIKTPEAGAVMPETGGFRKVRWRDPRRGKGKRGGLRVIHYYFPEDAQIWFVFLYDKAQADDLTPAEKKALRQAIATEKTARATARKR